MPCPAVGGLAAQLRTWTTEGGGARSVVEVEIQELKLALAEATVQLRIWQKGSEYVDQVPSQTSRP